MNKPFCCVLLLASLSLCLLSCGDGSADGGSGGEAPCNARTGTTCESLLVNGKKRTYLQHVPANFQQNTSALVIVLHGSGGSGLDMESSTAFSTLAEQTGFAVVYPDGLVEPSTGQPDWAYFFNDFADDVSFLRQLINAVQGSVRPDPRKIYVTGFSAGAFMSYRLGVELSNLIAAIGAVEGAVSSNGNPQAVPDAAGPVSVLMLHGDADASVLYCGSSVDASQDESFNYWTSTSANHCSMVDPPMALCDAQGNITMVIEKSATGCSGNTEVKFYKLLGGTHAWNTGPMNVPGAAPFNPSFDSTTGITTRDIVWKFFAAHPKP